MWTKDPRKIIKNMIPSLFSNKDIYKLEHKANGRSRKIDALPNTSKRKIIYDNMHLLDSIKFTSDGTFPLMEKYVGKIDFDYIAYTERNKHDGTGQALHFFLDDYKFREAVWRKLEYTTMSVCKFDAIVTPDLSLWRDLPTNFYNYQNVYRNRFIGAYWQHCGFNVIPCASWGDLASFKYCFKGLPDDSVIAVSGMGNRKNKDSYNRWCYGVRRLEEEKKPRLILVYGPEIEIPHISTKVQFIPDFITSKLRLL